MKWNDSLEKENLLNGSRLIIEKFKKIINKISLLTNEKISLPNIGITYNNKIVEIIQLYFKNGVTLYKSSLNSVIISYLLGIVEQAMENINECVSILESFSANMSDYYNSKKITELKEHLKIYRSLDKKLFDFDLEKNLMEAIEYDIEINELREKSGGYNKYHGTTEEIENGFNQELKMLGLSSNISINNTHTINSTEKKTKILQLPFIKCEEIESSLKKRGIEVPYIMSAIKNQLIDYLDLASECYNNGNHEGYVEYIKKIENFDIDEEIVSSVGKYVAYWEDINSFHNLDTWKLIKLELIDAGFGEKIFQIEKDLKSNVHNDYVEKRNANLKEREEQAMHDIEKSILVDEDGQDDVIKR